MSHEIEADFVTNWHNEATQCSCCSSFVYGESGPYCNEAKSEVPENGHCDFFQSID